MKIKATLNEEGILTAAISRLGKDAATEANADIPTEFTFNTDVQDHVEHFMGSMGFGCSDYSLSLEK